MNHYYTDNTNLESNITIFKYNYGGKELKFKSDNGVFSKERVDFGSNLLINSLPELRDVKSVLDVGCGVGILVICIKSKYKDVKLMMIDVNDRALNLAKENTKLNGINDCVIVKSNLYENVNEKFDCIVSNPPIRAGKDIVHGVIVDGYNHLNIGGKIYVVIQKKQGAPSLEKKMMEVFGNVKTINKKNGYFIFEGVKNN